MGIASPASGPEYNQFVSVWNQFCEKYLATFSTLNRDGYPYLVRVFDRILWLIGKDQYTVPAYLRSSLAIEGDADEDDGQEAPL